MGDGHAANVWKRMSRRATVAEEVAHLDSVQVAQSLHPIGVNTTADRVCEVSSRPGLRD